MSAEPEATSPLALLRVTFAHEYVAGEYTEFRLGPLAATARALRKLGLRFVREGAALTLYASVDAQRRIPRDQYRAALAAATLCWQFVPGAETFAAFTSLDVVAAQQCAILTRQTPSPQGGALSQGDTVANADLWPRQPLRFSYAPTRPLVAGTELTLETSAGTALTSVTVFNPALINIDVTPFGSGLYRLVQGDDVLTTWFADERGMSAALPSTILVLPGALLLAAYSNALGNMLADAALPVYTAKFAARAVIWRYRVFNAAKGEQLTIVPFAGEPLTMDEPPPAKPRASRGRKARAPARDSFVAVDDPSLPAAQSFEAVTPLKLAQRPTQRFALHSGASTRFAPLPLAGLAFGRSLRSPALCSEIFVYL